MNPAPPPGLSRRGFIAAAGGAALAAALPRRLAAQPPPPPFEVCASLYAWELHDEGVERVLDNVQGMAAVNSVYLVGLMHPERRPFGGGSFPHNPVRKTWMAEDARCYWHPQLSRYGRIKPRLSDFAWLNGTDWLRELSEAARRRGLSRGVELSHALIDRQRMAGEFADLAQRNIHGAVTETGAIPWLRPPCPNHPDTKEYALALASDAAANNQLDFVQSCIINFDPAPPEKGGGCFCDHCKAAAGIDGLDLGRVQAALLARPRDAAALKDWNRFRYASVGRFYQVVHAGLQQTSPGTEVRYNIHSRQYRNFGVDPSLLRAHVDSMRVMDYTEQEGNPALMAGKRTWLAETRRQVGEGFPLISAIGTRLKATPELIREGVGIAVEGGMQGIALGHYDGASFPMLRAIRQGLVEAGAPGISAGA